MEYSTLYYIVVVSGAFSLASAFMKGIEYLDTPNKTRRPTRR